MQETKTTWHLEHRRNERVLSLVQDENNGNVATLNVVRADYEANARLIAAAPELLEALEWLTGDWHDGWSRMEGICKWMDAVDDELVAVVGPLDREVQRDLREWIEKSREAIRKARGE